MGEGKNSFFTRKWVDREKFFSANTDLCKIMEIEKFYAKNGFIYPKDKKDWTINCGKIN